jgi:hypothetical protein
MFLDESRPVDRGAVWHMLNSSTLSHFKESRKGSICVSCNVVQKTFLFSSSRCYSKLFEQSRYLNMRMNGYFVQRMAEEVEGNQTMQLSISLK